MADSVSRTVMIVEDSRVQAIELSELLCANGYDVLLAGNGKEAIALSKRVRPSLVLSDVVMPVMDGFTMCRELKSGAATSGIPLVLLTTLAAPEDIIRGIDSGADGYITKPFSPEFLLAKVASLLSGPCQVFNNPEEKRIEVEYNGKKFIVNAGRAQTVSFLLSTYENAVMQNNALSRVQQELKELNERLEDKVRERTSALLAEIAEKKAAERALRESEETFRAVIEAANDAVICLGRPDTIYVWNRKAEEMFGYPASEAIGKGLHTLVVPDEYRERAFSRLKEFFETGEGEIVGRTVEVKALRRDGTEFPVEVSLSAFKIGGQWNSVGIIRDITERKLLEEDMRQNLEDVERMNRLMVGRELKMEDLRAEVRKLRARLKELEDSAKSEDRLKTG